MKLHNVLVLLFGGYALCSVINNVRLVDHHSYMIKVITKTMNLVEQKSWCNLKLPDYEVHLNETVLNKQVLGNLRYINGFVVSMQRVDIQQLTVQQVWLFNSTSQTTSVNVRGTMRMQHVAVGYDVEADLEDGNHRYTAVYVHPLINFAFTVIRNMNTNALDVTVVGTVPTTSLRPDFRPRDNTSDVLTSMFNPITITAAGIIAWGPTVFQPITLDVVTKQVEFPTVCYDCPIVP